MRLQVLISTMHQRKYDLLNKMRIQSDAIVINQTNFDSMKIINYEDNRINWINTIDRGLSCSRNRALDNADGDICLFSDDDLEYVEAYEKIVIEQFEKHPEADIITFQVEGIDAHFKDYYPRSRELNYLTSMKVASVEIAFRSKSVNAKNISFNNLFGSGAKYIMGEENIFLFDCLRKKMKIIYVPIKIANLYVGESTWFNGFDQDYFISKGAAFTAMSKSFSLLFIIQFSLRKYKIYKNDLSFFKALELMLKGRKQYLE